MKVNLGIEGDTHKKLHFINCLIYHKEGYINSAVDSINYYKDEIGLLCKKDIDGNLGYREKKILDEYRKYLRETEDFVNGFISVFEKFKNSDYKEVELTNLEYDVLKDVLECQIEHSEERLDDFKNERFSFCKSPKLIDQETEYKNVIKDILKNITI